ncbi:MAG: AAA family ATPase, partial [Candidatus Gastranaerophilales bacterium]|nr:AAA family ATPase [Candidatus Gastranaerophilales bacterium]
MSKLVFKNIIIEKSAKDIKTGVNYEFSEGFNLICGNNEAGKSSLMNFIKQGFFREKGVDTGKIYFYLADEENNLKSYRADIKDARLTEPRLKLFDENNNSVSYKFIEKNINQKYFEQGFFIRLDDLMNIQNKDTSVLVDIIKDPSGEKLTSYIEEKKAEAKKILGENNRLTKEITLICDKISNLNIKINELSNKEAQYNNAVNSIKSLSSEIETLCRQEEYVNILSEHKKLQQQLETLNNEYERLKLNFNEKLFNNKETYLNIIHNAGRYEADLKSVEKHKNKSELLISEITADINRLNSEFTLNIEENTLNDFIPDFSQIKKIKDYISQKNSLEKELIALNSNKENLEENLLKLKHELIALSVKTNQTDNINELKELYSFLDDVLKQYNFLISKINNVENNLKANS